MNPFVAAALKAGISQASIDSFLSNNPGDEHRLPTAFDFSEAGINLPANGVPSVAWQPAGSSTSLIPLLLVASAGAWWWFKGRKG